MAGWLYISDDGIEWSEQHPVRSGEVPDARMIRRGTNAELLAALKDAWSAHREAVQGEADYSRRWRDAESERDTLRAALREIADLDKFGGYNTACERARQALAVISAGQK